MLSCTALVLCACVLVSSSCSLLTTMTHRVTGLRNGRAERGKGGGVVRHCVWSV